MDATTLSEADRQTALAWPFGDAGPSPLHVPCRTCGVEVGESCIVRVRGASHGSRNHDARALREALKAG